MGVATFYMVGMQVLLAKQNDYCFVWISCDRELIQVILCS